MKKKTFARTKKRYISNSNKKGILRENKNNTNKKFYGGSSVVQTNDDGYGFLVANITSNNLDNCDCEPVDTFIANFLVMRKVESITFPRPRTGMFSHGDEENTTAVLGTIGLMAGGEEVYCNSNYINTKTLALINAYPNTCWDEGSVRGAFTKYVQWIMFHFASISYISYHSFTNGNLSEANYTHIKIRFMQDYTNWRILSRITSTDSPFVNLARSIIETNADAFPEETTIDTEVKTYIIEVCNEFLTVCEGGNISNMAEEYILFLYIAANLKGFTLNGALLSDKAYNKLEVLLYHLPSFEADNREHDRNITTYGANESIGQIIRFLSLAQVAYTPNEDIGRKVIPPIAVHFRDGHASCASINSFVFEREWLKTPFRYLTGSSIAYNFCWHERRKGMFAGFVSAKRDLSDESIMTKRQWKHTFGRAFCPIRDRLGSMKVCPVRRGVKTGRPQYDYGIDEAVGNYMYLDSNLLAGWQKGVEKYLQQIFDNTVYIHIMWFGHFQGVNIDYIKNDRYYVKDKTQQQINALDVWGNLPINANGPQTMQVDPRVTPVYVQIFWYQHSAYIKLLFNFFYYLYLGIHPEQRGVTWLALKTFMYTIQDAIIGINAKPNTKREKVIKNLAQFRPSGMTSAVITDEAFAIIIITIPPIYAFFSSLFNNSDNPTSYGNEQFIPYASNVTVWADLQHFYNGALTPKSSRATFLKYYMKLYSLYQSFHAIKTGARRKDCLRGWDLKQWYNYTEDVTVNLSDNLQKLDFR
jgi:hypothetical protein